MVCLTRSGVNFLRGRAFIKSFLLPHMATLAASGLMAGRFNVSAVPQMGGGAKCPAFPGPSPSNDGHATTRGNGMMAAEYFLQTNLSGRWLQILVLAVLPWCPKLSAIPGKRLSPLYHERNFGRCEPRCCVLKRHFCFLVLFFFFGMFQLDNMILKPA